MQRRGLCFPLERGGCEADGVCNPCKIRSYEVNEMRICYNPKLKNLARTLRNNSTLSEVLLWNHLKGKQMKGYDFHRQKPLDNYIVDFFCPKLRLIIEIDGESHLFKGKDDQKLKAKMTKREKIVSNF